MKQLRQDWKEIWTLRGVTGLFVAAILSLSCMNVQAFDPAKIVDGNGAMDSAYELPDAASIERAKKKSDLSNLYAKYKEAGDYEKMIEILNQNYGLDPLRDEAIRNEYRDWAKATAAKKVVLGKKVLYRHRQDVTTIVAKEQDQGEAAALSMASLIMGQKTEEWAVARTLKEQRKQGVAVADSLASYLNTYFFGIDKPAKPTDAGYRVAPVTTDKLDSKEYQIFVERLKKNVHDGYPLLVQADSSCFYPLESGDRYYLVTGYMEDKSGEVAYIYFQDSSSKHQDHQWHGLKYAPVEEFWQAVAKASAPSYLW